MLAIILQYVVDGIMIGLSYGLVGMGLTMIFGMLNILNLAHGEMYMLGAMIAYFLTSKLSLGFFPSLMLTVVGAFLIGLLLDAILMKRIRHSPHTMSGAITIGLSMFLANSMYLIVGPTPLAIKTPFELRPVFIGPIMLTYSRIFAGGITLAAILFTTWLIRHTKLGRAIRATIQDNMAAQLVGIKSNRIYAFGFSYGTALAALSGVLLGSMFVVTPFMGDAMTMKSWTVVIVGGLGNIPGAIFAGLLMGVAESLASGLWNSSWANLVAFILVIFVLVIKPQGLFSRS